MGCVRGRRGEGKFGGLTEGRGDEGVVEALGEAVEAASWISLGD